MKMARLVYLLLLCAFSFSSSAQPNYLLSDPIDIPEEGWNRLLQMKNGNTVLFHFENRKSILVKIFDKNGKEIASEKHLCKVIDINALDRSYFDGIFEIGNEAVLFITQAIDNKQTLVRIRFDAATAKLIGEEKVIQSPSFNKKINSFVLREKEVDFYGIVNYSQKSTREAEGKIELNLFSENHKPLRQLPVELIDEKFDYISYAGSNMDKTGSILISIKLSKIIQYPDITEDYLVLFYLPKGFTNFVINRVKLGSGSQNISTYFTYNPFAKKLNVVLTNEVSARVQTGVVKHNVTYIFQSLLTMAEDLSAITHTPIKNIKANQQLNEMTGKTTKYEGEVVLLSTNNLGVTTTISTPRYDIMDSGVNRAKLSAYKGDLAVTQYNDDGQEIWGTMLKKARHYTTAYKNHAEVFYGSSSIYALHGVECVSAKNSFYIFFNDYNQNFDKTEPVPISGFETTNAVFYTINRKRVVTKNYLFGAPVEKEYKQIFTSCSDFNEASSTYTTLLLNKKGERSTVHIAWCQLQ
jgi:hypothetical protein